MGCPIPSAPAYILTERPNESVDGQADASVNQLSMFFADFALFRLLPMDSVLAGDRQAADGSDFRRVELQLEHRKIKQDISNIVVRHGDWVELRWRSDEPGRIHTHGYAIEQRVGREVPAVTRFQARATGRFPITAHGFSGPAPRGETDGRSHHQILLYLEVHPRQESVGLNTNLLRKSRIWSSLADLPR